MLPKKKRVTKELFKLIMKEGKVIQGSLFLFRYIPQPLPQYAFVAPKNIAKKATQRNSLRRRGYSALSRHKIKASAGIFFYKKEGKEASFEAISSDIKSILAKARLLL